MTDELFAPLTLPCGVVLKNRLVKSAMSDSLGDGTGHPTDAQGVLYRRWAEGGVAASIVGEVQGSSGFVEKPGNLVLDVASDLQRFRDFADEGVAQGSALWMQLGHAGAMAYPPTSKAAGPSALDVPGLTCAEMTLDEVRAVPVAFARTAALAKEVGVGGVQIHAAHGFLLSQFLSPLFNQRTDHYGGSIAGRMALLLESIDAVRVAVGPDYPIAVKLNATDQLQGGLTESEALQVVAALDTTSVDLIDISGGTYFPGAASASDRAGSGPYFREFACSARGVTTKPLMLTGGFKTRDQAVDAVASGTVDIVGLARALIVAPDLPNQWRAGENLTPKFPRFDSPPEGGVTAWYTMQLTALAEGREMKLGLSEAIDAYNARDAARLAIWQHHFGPVV